MILSATLLVLALQASDLLAPRQPLARAELRAAPAPFHQLVVKFVDQARVRLSPDDALVSTSAADLGALPPMVAAYGLRFRPLLQLPEATLRALEERAARRSGRAQPDLAGMFVVERPGASITELQALGTYLQDLPQVEFASLEARGVPPPGDVAPPTPDHIADQDYRGPNPGLDAKFAIACNGHGLDVQLSDCEYGWNYDHEDLIDKNLHPEPGQTIHPNVYANGWDEHGTAVLGETSAVANGYGCTGMTFNARVHTYPEWTTQQGFRRTTCIANAIADSAPGDVVLLEMQTGSLAPAETDASVFVVVQAGTDAGVIVVGAAGNGAQNLDGPNYATYRSWGDSGAIIVGAGTPNLAHSRLSFSTYGSRVDLQGWGDGVFTLGYGGFATYGGDPNQRYTASFSGTSSASPFLASACAAIQSIVKADGEPPLSPQALRQLLVDTGRPQGLGSPIGPFPDLRAAIRELYPLFLAVDPSRAPLGASVQFSLEKGAVASPYLLTVTSVSGIPTSVVIGSGLFNLNGELSFPANIPQNPNLSGLRVGLRAYGLINGNLQASNPFFLSIQ